MPLHNHPHASNQPTHSFTAFQAYLASFQLSPHSAPTLTQEVLIENTPVTCYINAFWTHKQRQSNALHEVPYRACFKAELPRFFIRTLTAPKQIVYDPFSGRGTTIVEAYLNDRRGVLNDINPLSTILAKPRVHPPTLTLIKQRLAEIKLDRSQKAEMDLSMFYHPHTEGELVSLKAYLARRTSDETKDALDDWIQMVATTRLTGHSKGFFSVYTLPPNQATSPENQVKINAKRNQVPEYRDVKQLIYRKSKSLLRVVHMADGHHPLQSPGDFRFFSEDARHLPGIEDNTIQLTITSPPFLDVVSYQDDNWLRLWFNSLDPNELSNKITTLASVDQWQAFMGEVFIELYRITKPGGWVAFEVGEVRKGKVKLDECVVPIGLKAGFRLLGIMINKQNFTKTSNIWGVSNNKLGTNTNRIVIFHKT